MIRLVFEELVGMFVDDGNLALLALILIALVTAAVKVLGLPPLVGGFLLLGGCLAISWRAPAAPRAAGRADGRLFSAKSAQTLEIWRKPLNLSFTGGATRSGAQTRGHSMTLAEERSGAEFWTAETPRRHGMDLTSVSAKSPTYAARQATVVVGRSVPGTSRP
ncbi:hypothetical protein ACVOMV_06170 [Mesorhizobium atlanticum]